jgi:hypothetical protein
MGLMRTFLAMIVPDMALHISMPQPQVYQVQAPSQSVQPNVDAEAARQKAASQAAADLIANGHESTNVGGKSIAYAAQAEALKKKNTGAGSDLVNSDAA